MRIHIEFGGYWNRLDDFLYRDSRGRTQWLILGLFIYHICVFIYDYAGYSESESIYRSGLISACFTFAYPFFKAAVSLAPKSEARSQTKPAFSPRQLFELNRRNVMVRISAAVLTAIFAIFGRKMQASALASRINRVRQVREPIARISGLRNIIDTATAARLTIDSSYLVSIEAEAQTTMKDKRFAPFCVDLLTSLYSYKSLESRPSTSLTNESHPENPGQLIRNARVLNEYSRVHTLGAYEIMEYGPILDPDLAYMASLTGAFSAIIMRQNTPVIGYYIMVFPGPQRSLPEEELIIDGWACSGTLFRLCRIRYNGGPLHLTGIAISTDCVLIGDGAQELLAQSRIVGYVRIISSFLKT